MHTFWAFFFLLPKVPQKVAGFADDVGGCDSQLPAGLVAEPSTPSFPDPERGTQRSVALWRFL